MVQHRTALFIRCPLGWTILNIRYFFPIYFISLVLVKWCMFRSVKAFYLFYVWHHSCSKKFQWGWKVHILGVGLVLCVRVRNKRKRSKIVIFPLFTNNDVTNRKPYSEYTPLYKYEQKWKKNNIVETTICTIGCRSVVFYIHKLNINRG